MLDCVARRVVGRQFGGRRVGAVESDGVAEFESSRARELEQDIKDCVCHGVSQLHWQTPNVSSEVVGLEQV